jgi:hypothetical protein
LIRWPGGKANVTTIYLLTFQERTRLLNASLSL